jgi:hypothetical protein
MQIQIKLVAVADVTLKVGQEIDATLTVDNGISTTEIEKGLVMMACSLPDPQQPTGWAAMNDVRRL